nr:lipoprotein [Alteromonas lipotrueiana]
MIVSALFVSACGYRGPLYLPEEAEKNGTENTDKVTLDSFQEHN